MIDSRIKTAVRAMRERRRDAAPCLTIIGPPGTGKTLSCRVLMRWLSFMNEHSSPSIFGNLAFAHSALKPEHSLARLFSMGASFTESEESINKIKWINYCDILFVDDVGSEPAWCNPGTMAAGLCDILDHRIYRRLSTVITSNLSADEILKRYGARLHSRMIVGASICILSGDDRRTP